MNWRRIRKYFLIVFCCGFVLAAVTCWWVGGSLVASCNQSIGSSPDDFPAKSLSIPGNIDNQNTGSDGPSIAAWYHETPNASATVLLLHPIRGDRRSMLTRAQLLAKHGYSSLLVDLQAHGETAGEQITFGYREKENVIAAIEFIRSEVPDQKIGIIGWSLGGAAALMAEPNVDAIVAESVYPTIDQAIENRVALRLKPLGLRFMEPMVSALLSVQLEPRLGIRPSDLEPIRHMKNIRCPVLVIAGSEDQHTTIDETKQLYEAATMVKSLEVFEGAKHDDLYQFDPSKYESAVIRFLKRELK